MTTNPTHQGPHPEHGGLETHVGTREQCSGPDCGPLDPEDEIRDAALNLDGILDDLRDPEIGRLLGELLHEIAEDWGPQLDRRPAIQEAAHKLAAKINAALGDSDG